MFVAAAVADTVNFFAVAATNDFMGVAVAAAPRPTPSPRSLWFAQWAGIGRGASPKLLQPCLDPLCSTNLRKTAAALPVHTCTN